MKMFVLALTILISGSMNAQIDSSSYEWNSTQDSVEFMSSINIEASNSNALKNKDFTLNITAPIWDSETDSTMFSTGNIGFCYLEFDLPDTLSTDANGFAAIHIEISDISGKSLLVRKSYTLNDLQSYGFIASGHVQIPLGNYDLTEQKRVSIMIEQNRGAMSRVFIKNITQ